MKCPVCGHTMAGEICPECLFTLLSNSPPVSVNASRRIIQRDPKTLAGCDHLLYHLAVQRLRREGEEHDDALLTGFVRDRILFRMPDAPAAELTVEQETDSNPEEISEYPEPAIPEPETHPSIYTGYVPDEDEARDQNPEVMVFDKPARKSEITDKAQRKIIKAAIRAQSKADKGSEPAGEVTEILSGDILVEGREDDKARRKSGLFSKKKAEESRKDIYYDDYFEPAPRTEEKGMLSDHNLFMFKVVGIGAACALVVLCIIVFQFMG